MLNYRFMSSTSCLVIPFYKDEEQNDTHQNKCNAVESLVIPHGRDKEETLKQFRI